MKSTNPSKSKTSLDEHGQVGAASAEKIVPTDASTETMDSTEGSFGIDHEELARRAYECWHARGCPEGSSEADWFEAERQIRTRRDELNAAATNAE